MNEYCALALLVALLLAVISAIPALYVALDDWLHIRRIRRTAKRHIQ